MRVRQVEEKISDECFFCSCSCKHQILIVIRVLKNLWILFPVTITYIGHRPPGGSPEPSKFFSSHKNAGSSDWRYTTFFIRVWIRIRCELLCVVWYRFHHHHTYVFCRVGHQIAATSEYHDRCLMETYLGTVRLRYHTIVIIFCCL